jgi:LmbE family N-acetylglucosaminyl deacetylase
VAGERPAASLVKGDGPAFFSLASRSRKGALQVLCLGAHADDIEIGCGATLLALFAARRNIDCRWVIFSGGGGPREAEARKSAGRYLARAARGDLAVHPFRDGYFPYIGGDIKDAFEALTRTVSPDLVFTHARDDRHQDHRVISDLTWNTFRSHLILEYEVPKYDGDLGTPNLFVPVSAAVARTKIRWLESAYASQRSKRWFTADTFHGLLRLRGVESGAPDGLAEAFYARKALVQF